MGGSKGSSGSPSSFAESVGSSKGAELAPEAERYTAISSLKLDEENSVEKLLRGMADSSWRVRSIALEVSGKFPPTPDFLQGLIDGLGSSQPTALRNTSSEALKQIGEPVVSALLDAVQEVDASQRKFIVEILGAIGTDAARDGLLSEIDDPDANVQSAVLEALGNIGGAVVIDALKNQLRKGNADLQFSSYLLGALSDCGASLRLSELKELLKVPVLRRFSCPLLGKSGEIEAFKLLVEYCDATSKSLRFEAIKGVQVFFKNASTSDLSKARNILRHDAKAIEKIKEILAEATSEIAESAVYVFTVLGDSHVAPDLLWASAEKPWVSMVLDHVHALGEPVVEHLLDGFWEVDADARILFIELLERFRAKQAVPSLIQVLEQGPQRNIEAAIHALGKISDERALISLVHLVETGEAGWEGGICRALIEIGKVHPTATSDTIRDSIHREGIRPIWLRVIGGLARDNELDVLIAAAGHVDAAIRLAAIAAAVAYGSRFPENLLIGSLQDESPKIRAKAAAALGAYASDSTIAALETAMGDSDALVVAKAVSSLSMSGGKMVLPTILNSLEHSASPVVIASLQALARFDTGEIEQAVLRALKSDDPEVVREAITTAQTLDDETALDLLTGCLQHRAWNVRLAAAEAMLRRHLKVSERRLQRYIDVEEEVLVRSCLERLLELRGDDE